MLIEFKNKVLSMLIVILMTMPFDSLQGSISDNPVLIMHVQDWSEAHNGRNIQLLNSLYAQTVQ